MGDQLPLPKGAIWLLVLLLIGVVLWQVYNGNIVSKIEGFGMGVEFEPSNSPPVKAQLVHENLLVSDYHEMYLNERNLFGATIALDDSVKEALSDLPTGHTVTNGEITPTYGDPKKAAGGSTNESMSVGTRVDLTGPTFDIEPATSLTSESQDIPHDNPGRNLAKWRWWVIPREKGPNTLFIEAYTVDEKGNRKSINSTKREIDVIVTSAPLTPAEEAAPAAEENVTEAAPTPAEEAAPAAANETAPAEQPSQPGFEGIFAITGLLAVAYLVLGRKR